MLIRFRRTLRIFPGLKINVSKSGISETIGFKGFHLTFGKHGVRQTIGLPGSGLSETSYIFKAGDNESEDSHKAEHAHKHGCYSALRPPRRVAQLRPAITASQCIQLAHAQPPPRVSDL